MSTPRQEPLGDAGAWPSMTKDVNVGKRYGKRPLRRQRPKDLQHPVATMGTELRELINRQDLLLLLLSKSLNLGDILAEEEDGQSMPNDSDPDEVKENYTFAASFHSDALLDNVGWEQAFQETVNLFLAVFKMEGSLLSYSTNFGLGNPNSYGLNFVMSEPSPREASPLDSTEKPILSIEGFGTNGRDIINIQWGELPERGSEGSVVDATKLTELLRSEWRKSGRPFILTQEYKLLNYDKKGCPICLSEDETDWDNEQRIKDVFRSEPYPLVFGTILVCRVVQSSLSLRELSLILRQLDARRSYLPRGSPESPGYATPSLVEASLRSALEFAGVWSGGHSHIHWTLSERGSSYIFWKRGDSGWTHIEHHFRFLQIYQAPEIVDTGAASRYQGLHCTRVDGTLKLPQGHKLKAFKLIEGRYTIAVTTTMTLKLPVYSVNILFEDRKKISSEGFMLELDQKTWQESNFQLGLCCKGITVFQLALFRIVKRYSEAWTRSLDAIDQIVQVQPANILDNESRRDLMFDRSLEKSELYFAVLQILRIMSEWIHESVTDIENQKESWADFHGAGHGKADYLSEEGRERDREVINSNWDMLGLHHAKLVQVLQDRIDRKTTEVESLRDGLFNATQVREATRATRISQYIFVFTVMTIFYLPLSFVAAIFGMHLFDGADLHETQTSFYISAVLIAVVTYLLSGLAVWWVGDLEREQEMKDWWQSWKAKHTNKKDNFKDTNTTGHDKMESAQSSARESRYTSLRELLRPRKKDGATPGAGSKVPPEP